MFFYKPINKDKNIKIRNHDASNPCLLMFENIKTYIFVGKFSPHLEPSAERCFGLFSFSAYVIV